ncbi:MAG: hypothetical protein JNJ46_32190 [Myxococcales bacterium]|nr:hypothetical protein [Myxococcales bacterium]
MPAPLPCVAKSSAFSVAAQRLSAAAWMFLALLPACESKGGQMMDPGPDLAGPERVDLGRDMADPKPLLATYAGCGSDLFADGTKPQDFGSQAAFEAAFRPAWAKPQVKDGALVFGPHPLTADWWENYSPAESIDKPGDVLLCARVRLTTQANDPVGDNSFELTLRKPEMGMYETSGMVLLIEGNASFVALRTRTGQDTWVTYDRVPLRMQSGSETRFELLSYGQGSRFVAEVKNTSTGEIARLRAESPLPAGGSVTVLGWRSRNGIYVDTLVMGQPSPAARDRLNVALTPAS